MKNKIKTHKASSKRFKLSASGKVKHNVQGNNHLKAGKNRAQKTRKKGFKVLNSKNEIAKIIKLTGIQQ